MSLDNELRGTTIVAVIYKDGAIIAADMQGTYMPTMDKLNEDVKKLILIGDYSVIGWAGVASVSDLLSDAKSALNYWKRVYGREVTIDGQFSFLSKQLFGPATITQAAPYGLLLVSFDVEQNKGRIFQMAAGVNIECKKGFVSIGSGANTAMTILKAEKYSDKATYKSAITVIRKALELSADISAGVGNKYFAYRISDDGIKDISDEVNLKEGKNG